MTVSSVPPDVFTKTRRGAPEGFFAVEAAGLRWLAAAGGVSVAEPVDVGEEQIQVRYVRQSSPSAAAAEDFGRALARTHLEGAGHHGCPPDGWTGDGWIASLPLPHSDRPLEWGRFYAELRLRPFTSALDRHGRRVVDAVCDRLQAGDESLTGPPEAASRLHGDLWSGNVLWTGHGVVLVDPAAHGGHRETDLAMLALFGLPHLDRVIAAYDEAAPLADGWQDRVRLHQMHPLLVHSVLFGGGYTAQASRTAAALLAR